MDTTKTTENQLLTTTEDDYDTWSSYDDYDTQYDYDYDSSFDELWDKYYSNTYTDTDSLYSTTGDDDTSYSYSSVSNNATANAIGAVATALASVMIFVVIFSLLYSVYISIAQFMIAKKMGRSTAFCVLSIFFWPVMAGILAFSKNKTSEGEARPVAEPVAPVAPVEPAAPVAPAPEAPTPETPVAENPAPEAQAGFAEHADETPKEQNLDKIKQPPRGLFLWLSVLFNDFAFDWFVRIILFFFG